MALQTLRFEHDYAFPRVIVWDALVDPDLVSGWLAQAAITPEAGGEYNLRWMHRSGSPVSPGRIVVLQPLERLHVDTADAGRLEFELAELAGGGRGSSTRLGLSVTVDVEPVFAARLTADWLTSLDQLHDLLHGHPVDWANWGRDMQPTWAQHFGAAENSTA